MHIVSLIDENNQNIVLCHLLEIPHIKNTNYNRNSKKKDKLIEKEKVIKMKI